MHVRKGRHALAPLIPPYLSRWLVHHRVHWEIGWHRQGLDPAQPFQVVLVRRLRRDLAIHSVDDGHGHSLRRLDDGAEGGVAGGELYPIKLPLRQCGAAPGAGKLELYSARGAVERLLGVDDFFRTRRTGKTLAPDGVADPTLGLPIRVQRLVHPADLFLQVVQELLRGFGERIDVEGNVVVGGNEGGGRGQVSQNGLPSAPLRRLSAVPPPLLFQLQAVLGRRRAAPLRGDAGHARTAEAIEHDVARLRVVEDGRHDGPVRHLGVVAVGLVERIGLADAHIHGERLAMVGLVGIVGLAVLFHELGEERIGAGRVVRRVGQAQDVLVLADGKVVALPQVRELLLQPGKEVVPPSVIGLEGHSEAFHRRCGVRPGDVGQQLASWSGPSQGACSLPRVPDAAPAAPVQRP